MSPGFVLPTLPANADPLRVVAVAAELVTSRYGSPPGIDLVLADGTCEAAAVDAEEYRLGDLLTLTGPCPVVQVRVGLSCVLTWSGSSVEISTEATDLPVSFAAHLSGVVEAAAWHPDRVFGEHDILTEDERRLLLGDWNGPEVAYPATTLHGMFAEQASRTPDAVALLDETRSLTYREVDLLSNRIAQGLRGRVPTAGAVVAVSGVRSIDVLVTKIGVMKAGAAFLYLDPATPATRVAQMCAIAAPVVVVGSRQVPLPPLDAPTVLLEDLLADVTASMDPVPEIADESTAAYVLFTSGSTGEPKGVIRPHRMNTTRVVLEQGMYGLGPDDRHLMKSVPFFREFFWALATGGAVVVARPGGERDDGYLVDLIRRTGVTVCSFVPSMLRVLLAHNDFRTPNLPVRHLFTAGESFDRDLEDQLRERGFPVHVTYTLAEADYVTHRGAALPPGGGTTAGRPLDMRIYLCDPLGRLVPPGVAGEVYTGGPGLADGYVNRPELTAERFLANPFEPQRAPTVFRTGDLGRHTADGQFEFVGRADAQVKIRGQRVEPTEVEHLLRRCPGVENALVAALADPDQGNVLVAYLQPAAGDVDTRAVRAFAHEHLPAHMVPTYLVAVAELPMLISGKLDRTALRTVVGVRAPELGPPTPPRGERERRVARVWATVLGMPEVGVDDTFVDLGGDSLKAMLLRSALETELGTPVDFASVLSAPTVRDFVEATP